MRGSARRPSRSPRWRSKPHDPSNDDASFPSGWCAAVMPTAHRLFLDPTQERAGTPDPPQSRAPSAPCRTFCGFDSRAGHSASEGRRSVLCHITPTASLSSRGVRCAALPTRSLTSPTPSVGRSSAGSRTPAAGFAIHRDERAAPRVAARFRRGAFSVGRSGSGLGMGVLVPTCGSTTRVRVPPRPVA